MRSRVTPADKLFALVAPGDDRAVAEFYVMEAAGYRAQSGENGIGERWEAAQPSPSPASCPLGPLAYRFSAARYAGSTDRLRRAVSIQTCSASRRMLKRRA